MKKIRITEPGWATFTGNYGGVEFVNAESVDLVSPFNASRLAALIRIEDSDGKNPSVAQQIVDSKHTAADQEMVSSVNTGVVHAEAKVSTLTGGYTRDQLAAVVDKGGIKALRQIAEPLGVRGTKVVDLIDKIILAQGGEPEPEPVPTDDAVVGDAEQAETVDVPEVAEAPATDTPAEA